MNNPSGVSGTPVRADDKYRVVVDDRELILRSLDEPAVFGELFERHVQVIHRVVARRVSGQAADDVVSETFLRAFERRHRFRADRDSALPWLFGIAMNVLREHARAQRRLVDHDEDLPDRRDALGDAERRIDARRELDAVLAALDDMPAGFREVVLLHVVGDLDYEGVAAALRIPIGTVRSRLNRARRRLRLLETTTTKEEGHRGLDGASACQPS